MNNWSKLLRSDPERGIRALQKAHGGLVYFTVRRILKGYPEDDIEECAADVFFYLYEKRDALDLEDDAIKAYLQKTALHRALVEDVLVEFEGDIRSRRHEVGAERHFAIDP